MEQLKDILRVFLRLSPGFMIQNTFRSHNIQLAFKIGQNFDHALMIYYGHHFI